MTGGGGCHPGRHPWKHAGLSKQTSQPQDMSIFMHPLRLLGRGVPFPTHIYGTINYPISYLLFSSLSSLKALLKLKQNTCLFYCHYPLSYKPAPHHPTAPKLLERITTVTAFKASAARTPYPSAQLSSGAETQLQPPANGLLFPAERWVLIAPLQGLAPRSRAPAWLPPPCRAFPGAPASRNALPVTPPA